MALEDVEDGLLRVDPAVVSLLPRPCFNVPMTLRTKVFDEAIDLLIRIFCVPATDSIMITPPTYGMYKVCANVNDVEIVKCPLTPAFDLRIEEVRDLFVVLAYVCMVSYIVFVELYLNSSI